MKPPEAANESSRFSPSWSGALNHLIQDHPPLKVMDEILFRSRMVLRFLQENVFHDRIDQECTLSCDALVGLRTILEATEEMLIHVNGVAEEMFAQDRRAAGKMEKVDDKSTPAK